jgi:hypothetical protein
MHAGGAVAGAAGGRGPDGGNRGQYDFVAPGCWTRLSCPSKAGRMDVTCRE